MTKAAFQATVHGFRTVPSRGVISITIECPIEHHAEIARIAEHGAWVAVARILNPEEKIEPVQTKKDWRDLQPTQQACMRCEEAAFTHFLRELWPDDWHETQDTADCVRLICGVASRSELSTNHKARVIWNQLDSQYSAWKLLERIA